MLTQLRHEPHLTRKLTYWGQTTYETEPLQFFRIVGHHTDNNVRISARPSRVHLPRHVHGNCSKTD